MIIEEHAMEYESPTLIRVGDVATLTTDHVKEVGFADGVMFLGIDIGTS